MNMLHRIVYAAHAKGTHHKLALDALRHLKVREAESWQHLFLKHADLYMQGSKAPDDEFKDFKNHVLHVRDGYWGGAPDKVEAWYGHLVTALRDQSWSEAVWAAGILSHYYTDPIQPFHTGQTEAENSIHRAAEWSISRSYDALMKQGEAEHSGLIVMPATSNKWLRDLVCQGADKSNQHYEKLIAHYDINQGVIDPPAGLDSVSRKVLAELIVYAAHGFALILDRAITEAGVAPPEVSLTLDTIIAAIKIPAKMLAKRLADAEDRRIVEAMYDELKATGRVEATLPEDDRVVRDLYEKEIAAPRSARLAGERTAAIASAGKAKKSKSLAGLSRAAAAPPALASAGHDAKRDHTATVTPLPSPKPSPSSSVRSYLGPADDLERAPSIGPKLAERLATAEIRTVGDLLSCDPAAIATKLAHPRITADTIAEWRDQSRLMVEVRGIRGSHAQLLVGAGLRSRDALASADADKLCVDLLAFAATEKGQAILRDGHPPDIERIKGWLVQAIAARAA
ncbi:MAG: DUF4332 domain-containing protein [Hyphomicrobium sp.]